jgi:patatin-like phospholipase/acyl hydrolase
MLIILEDLMWKLKGAENLPDIPHPCDYFDLIGGTSTGGHVLHSSMNICRVLISY